MTSLVIYCALLLSHLLACQSEARPADPTSALAEAPPASSITLATTSVPTGSIEDSLSSEDDQMCFLCNDLYKSAQNLISVQMKLLDQQKEYIRQKKNKKLNDITIKPALRSAPISSSSIPSSNSQGDPISKRTTLVSTLRVARDTTKPRKDEQIGANSTRTSRTRNIDPYLKQLKLKQEHQLNATCHSLYKVQQCLADIKAECLGDLKYHSVEVVTLQWTNKLNCPPRHKPNFKFFEGLRNVLPTEEENGPIARSISSPEETQKRLDATLGYMLKPALTTTASKTFDSLKVASHKFGGSTGDFIQIPKRPRHFATNEIETGPRHQEAQLMVPSSHLLLVPCFLVIIVALLNLSKRYLRQTSSKV